MRSRHLLTMVTATLFVLAAGSASAQHAGLTINVNGVKRAPTESFQQESLQPSGQPASEAFQPVQSPLESILYDSNHSWAQGNAGQDLYNFDVEWGAVDGLTVSRNFSQKRVAAKDRPLDLAIQEQTTESASVSPFQGFNLTVSKSMVETRDFTNLSLGGSETQTLAVKQAFGGGVSGGTMDFSRTVTSNLAPEDAGLEFSPLTKTQTTTNEQMKLLQNFAVMGKTAKVEYTRGLTTIEKPDKQALEQRSQGIAFDMGLWADTNVKAGFQNSHANTEAGLHMQDRSFSVSREFNTGAALVSVGNKAVRQGGTTTATKTQQYHIPMRLDGRTVAMAFDATTVQVNERLTEESRSATLATKLWGNDVKWSWARNLKQVKGQAIKESKAAFSLPFNFFGEDTAFNFSSDATQTNDVLTKKLRVAQLALPLTHFRKGAKFNLEVKGFQEKAGQPFQEVRTATLLLPMSFFGTEIAPEFQRITKHTPAGKEMMFSAKTAAPISLMNKRLDTQHQYIALNRPDGSEQNQFNTTVNVPFKPGALTIKRLSTTDISASGDAKQTRVVNVITPRVPVNKATVTSLQADMQRTDLPGGTDHKISHVNLQSQPIRAMTLSADYRLTDLGPDRETERHQVDAAYNLSKRLALNWRYLEQEQLDQSPLIQRTMVLQHKPAKASDLDLRAALTSTDAQNADSGLMKIVEMKVGDQEKLVAVDLRYQEYDEKKLTELADPTIAVNVTHGSPDALHLQVGYQDWSGRADPLRQYNVGFPLGDTSLELGFTQNGLDPKDPKQKAIRLADSYDATISRKMFGDVDMNVSYRYCEFPDDASVGERIDQWLQMQLAGGQVSKGGLIKLSFASGDFVPLVKEKVQNTPTSQLSLQYDKQWSDDGNKLTLRLDRTTMPETGTALEDSYEGRLQFDYRF